MGGLLPNPTAKEEKPSCMVAHEWTVNVAPQEAELHRERENLTAPFPEGPDKRGGGEALMLWDNLCDPRDRSPGSDKGCYTNKPMGLQ